MGQLSGHSCVVHDQGPGLWSPLGITLLPSSSVLSVLPQVFFHLPLETLFCQCLSFCVSPTAPCTASTCVSPHIPQRVYHHVSPQAPFLHKSLKLPLLDVPSVPPSCQYFLSTCEPKDLPPPCCLASVWGETGCLQWCQSQCGPHGILQLPAAQTCHFGLTHEHLAPDLTLFFPSLLTFSELALIHCC